MCGIAGIFNYSGSESPKLKIDKYHQKTILRELAQQKIHSDCLSMKKKGFRLPIKQWADTPLHAFVNESLQKLKDRNIINPTTVTKWEHEYQKGKRPVGNLWHLVSLELWFQSFVDHGGLTK